MFDSPSLRVAAVVFTIAHATRLSGVLSAAAGQLTAAHSCTALGRHNSQKGRHPSDRDRESPQIGTFTWNSVFLFVVGVLLRLLAASPNRSSRLVAATDALPPAENERELYF